MTAWILLVMLIVGIAFVLRLVRPRDDFLHLPPPHGPKLWRRSAPWK